MLRIPLKILALIVVTFIVPSLLHMAVWAAQNRPASWRQADWSSAGVLPNPRLDENAIYVLVARTGGLKGALATHSWIVTKKAGERRYDRYDVVGWGTPVRKNGYPADGRWYSNTPRIHYQMKGKDTGPLIAQLKTAIANYRWRNRGDYTLWPGPNSNTFVASVMRAVPELDIPMPATAVGRDYPANGKWFTRSRSGAWRATLAGYAGFVLGGEEGFEINFLGLVAGVNLPKGQIKIPAFGTVSLWSAS